MKTHPDQFLFEVVSDKTVLDVVHETASQIDDPFYVVDLSDIVYKHKLWKVNMPRVQPYYAMKCNDNPVILTLLSALGAGFDCASKAEIDAVLSLGVEPSRIIYANPCKSRSFIKYAETVGVDLMTFDSELELHKVRLHHPKARMVIRIRADDASAKIKLGMKFGCMVQDAPHLLQAAKKMGINVVGVSFHVGSGCKDFTAYSKGILSCRYIFDLARSMGFDMSFLDLGGGFPGHHNCKGVIEEAAVIINDALETHFPVSSYSDIKIVAEPGRYYVTSAFTLCVNIISTKVIPSMDAEGDHMMYYLNDGLYGSFNCVIFDPVVLRPNTLADSSSRPLLRSSVWGPTCDSIDVVMESCVLPQMNVDEWLYFENMGAYTIVAASTFNGFQMPVFKFILPLQTLNYLRQLPSWPQLVQSLNVANWLDETNVDESLSAHFNLMPVSKPLSA